MAMCFVAGGGCSVLQCGVLNWCLRLCVGCWCIVCCLLSVALLVSCVDVACRCCCGLMLWFIGVGVAVCCADLWC